jgi:4-hydroxy-tetrahydrodipicolinate reductase
MVAIAIAGAAGRMGRSILQLIVDRADLSVAGLLDRADNPSQGVDAGVLLGCAPMNVAVSADVDAVIARADVLIDFTIPAVSLSHAERCAVLGKPIVIGTTGFDAEQKQRLAKLAQRIAIVHAPNMSPGVNLAFKLVELAARALKGQVDVEIIEAHHRHKLDSPSGTALRFGEVVAQQLDLNLATQAVYGREGQVGARPDQQIGFATIRGGDIVGEHTVMFIGEGERLEITHHATSRQNFAAGAVRAAEWIINQPPGLYDMPHVLGIDQLGAV